MWRRLALSCSICSSMSERVVRRRPFLSMRVLRLAVVGLPLSGALPWSSTLALMVGRHFPARDAGLPQHGPSRAAIAAASRLRAAAVDTAVPLIRALGGVAFSSNDVAWREPAAVRAGRRPASVAH